MMRWASAGHLTDVPFAGIFGALAVEKHTGLLRLEQDSRIFSLAFREGEIVDAESGAPEDTVGRVALDAGMVDAATVSESIRRLAREPGKSQRDILVEMGAIGAEDATRLARLTLTRRALRLFALPQAGYSVEPGDPRLDAGGPMEARWVLYRGLRTSYDERRLDKELADLADKAIRLPGDDSVLAPFGFSDEERIVAGYLQKGYWELFDLVDACMTLPRPAVLAVVLSLYSAGALDAQPIGSVPRLRKRAREATMRLSRESMPVSPSTALGTRPPGTLPPAKPATVPPAAAKPATVPPAGAKPTTVPPAGAKPTTVPPAGAKPTTIPPKPGTDPPRLPRPGIQAPFRPSTTSPAVSQNSATIAASDAVIQTIREQIRSKLAQIEAHADHYAILEIDRKASSTEIKAAYFALAKTYHPDRLALVKLEALRPQVERIFAKLSDAYATLSDDGRRQEYMKVLAQGGEQAVRRREDDETARATKVLTAEEHFRKGEMALRRENYPLAEKEFQSALDLNENEPEHHALYAWSRWCAASDKSSVFSEVKKGLERALKLSDRCVPAMLYLGEVYTARGEHERAYNWFQRVLGVEEHHVEAQRQVRLIEMRRKGDKKGIFDRFRKK